MFHPLQLLAQLPKIRTGLLLACLLAGCADLITSIVLLAYQLALTVSVVPPFIERAILAETDSRHSLRSCVADWIQPRRTFARRHFVPHGANPGLVRLLETVRDPVADIVGERARRRKQARRRREVHEECHGRVDLPRRRRRVDPDHRVRLARRVSSMLFLSVFTSVRTARPRRQNLNRSRSIELPA